MTELRLEWLIGSQLHPYLDAVASLRIEVFRSFPYLYVGDQDYEARYLQTYSACPQSLCVLVFDGAQVVGASTGIPLAAEEAAFQQPFRDHGYDPAQVFYFGESVVRASYRGRGLGVRFFHIREDYARTLAGCTHTAFCAVERPANHPRRPPDYVPLDSFWHKRGYTRHPTLRTTYTWQDLDEAEASPKPMAFWLKQL